jgi:hypothetical protein
MLRMYTNFISIELHQKHTTKSCETIPLSKKFRDQIFGVDQILDTEKIGKQFFY